MKTKGNILNYNIVLEQYVGLAYLMGGYHTDEKSNTMTYLYDFALPTELLEQYSSQGGENKLVNITIPFVVKTKKY